MATAPRTTRLLVAAVLAASLSTSLAACGATATAAHLASTTKVAPRLGAATEGRLRLSRGWVTEVDAGPSAPASPSSSGGAMGMDMSRTGAAYFTIHDDGSASDPLVSASSASARQVELHATTSSADGSSGTMTAVPDIPVPAGGSAVLRPGGYHLMLVGPVRSLKAGDSVVLTLSFRSGAVMTVRLPVLDREDRPGS